LDKDKQVYYWIMLKDDFFEDEAIKVIESMDNGKDYVLFLLKLYIKSAKKDGYLKLTEAIPYSPKTLASITSTNIDIVDKAIKIFQDFNLLSVCDDGTIYLNRIKEMVGSETHSSVRKRIYREKQTAIENNKQQGVLGQSPSDVPPMSHRVKSKEIRDKNIIPAELVSKFELIWEKYPKKLGKKAALKHYSATVKSLDDFTLIEKALVNYTDSLRKNGTEDKYIQNGSTWFNNWHDWITINKKQEINVWGGLKDVE